ncbi:PREDICTED: uncharacterized protein LOC109187410 [Ipomoea nil]|uniref:uncharacterized protein LOC109187410 n=1 Tax=Ipomoea nil TaxID=35883 RepID=UPI00090103C0|nr:PREDICTED: uncharacterized protein LOC109187410 [Ipomoea nil]
MTKPIFYFKQVFIIVTFALIFFLVLNYHTTPPPVFYSLSSLSAAAGDTTPTAAHHLLFAIASSAKTFPGRKDYIGLWYRPNSTRAYVFLDRLPPGANNASDPTTLPPLLIHESTAGFPYNNSKGHRSAVAIARMVKAVAMRNESDVRWYVFGDDDTVFFVENVVSTLSKYDHEQWYYVGANSESYEQNAYFSFHMGFGGGGFALSHGLAKVLGSVLDSCIVRYPHLYGSDARIFACLAELGISLTHEPGFHQTDVWGNLFGFLASHPQSLLLSLHHLDEVQPLFPNMSRPQALKHFFAAVHADPPRISQQTICYDQNNSLSVSVSWGYVVQVYQGYYPLPDLLPALRTFLPWDKDRGHPRFMFNTRPVPADPCKRPLLFFLDTVHSNGTTNVVSTRYSRHGLVERCSTHSKLLMGLKEIKVISKRLDNVDDTIRQVKAPRRQCCDITWSSDRTTMDIRIRPRGIDELTTMFT